jgi:pimeloyl-ACP methyl ester carboxylesterase
MRTLTAGGRVMRVAVREGSPQWPPLLLLPLLRQPTLILAGDDDPIIPLANARIMRLLIRRSELNIYHGGHLDLVSEAGRMAPIVEAFLTAQPGSAAGSPDGAAVGAHLGLLKRENG